MMAKMEKIKEKVKEHPIIFSTDMVQAILEDRKTQTRRVIKPQPKDRPIVDAYDWWHWVDIKGIGHDKHCPYGQVGDRLWVRRTKEGKFIWKKAEAEVWLEITGVRVERLQEISNKNAKAEGVELTEWWIPEMPSPRHAFAYLWSFINAKYGWETNCWVWVIEFKKI